MVNHIAPAVSLQSLVSFAPQLLIQELFCGFTNGKDVQRPRPPANGMLWYRGRENGDVGAEWKLHISSSTTQRDHQ